MTTPLTPVMVRGVRIEDGAVVATHMRRIAGDNFGPDTIAAEDGSYLHIEDVAKLLEGYAELVDRNASVGAVGMVASRALRTMATHIRGKEI